MPDIGERTAVCVLCQTFQPWSENCVYPEEQAATASGSSVSAPTQLYTYDQIADQLTDGFWASFGGGSRSFDVVTGGTLYVDITGLASNGQAMARQALDAWTSVTGMNFVEIDSSIPPNQTVSEFLDAPSNPITPYAVQVGDDFLGSLGTGADRDTVAIALTAGQNITIELSGNTANGNATADPFLWLLDGAGNVIAANDDAF
ncbi:MAG: hypothetical protein KJO67_08845, partial [Silicimonas sp.]|nr:hypothetical protein [Silicimonas sp.]